MEIREKKQEFRDDQERQREAAVSQLLAHLVTDSRNYTGRRVALGVS
jgi:hypothetical protein